MEHLISLKDIKLSYGRFQLDVPTLEIIKGERLCIIGPNGSGKSTLLRIMALLESPAQGEIRFNNTPVTRPNAGAIRKNITMVLNEPVLYRGTVQDNLMLGLKLRRITGNEAGRRIDEALALFGITDLKHSDAAKLSSGQKQRVNLARALALNPDLLLLDEPNITLDAPTRETLLLELQRILSSRNITSVLVTQDRDEALSFAQQLGVIINGRILQTGTPAEVFNSPINQQVAEFVGMNTIIDGTVVSYQNGISLVRVSGNNTISVHSSQLMPEGQAVVLGIRPEEVLLMAQDIDSHSLSARNKFRAKVFQVTPREGQYKVSVECSGDDNQAGFILNSLVTPSAVKDLGIEAGKILIAVFKANAVHIIRK